MSTEKPTRFWARRIYTPVHVVTILLLVLLAGLVGSHYFLGHMARAASGNFLQRIHGAIYTTDMPEVVIAPRQLPPIEPAYQQPYDFRFRNDAFSWNVPMWTKLTAPYVGQPELRYLEIGLDVGRCFFWMLENVMTDPSSTMTGIDLFDGDLRDRFMGNLKLCGAEDRITIINEASQTALRGLPLESFDIIYIDGSHVKCDVLEDAVLSWRLLKPGGLLIFDNYEHIRTSKEAEGYEAPKVAIDAFYTCFDHQCEVLHNDWQVVLRKR